jgi:serine/threonine protein kinase
MSLELTEIAKHLRSAGSYLDVFGACNGDRKNQTVHVKRIYRRLARTVHPDLYENQDEKQLAEEAFRSLQAFNDAALKAIKNGGYGHSPKAVIKTKRFRHELAGVLVKEDIADLFAAETIGGSTLSSVVKLARKPGDSDLMDTEAKALKRLLEPDGNDQLHPFFPELLDHFVYIGKGGVRRRGNVIERLAGWYNLREVRQAYPSGLDPLDMVWIWRKTLWALGYAHQRGLIHGAVWPDHIMIHPKMHGLKLIDWCYSTSLGDDGFAPNAIKAIVPKYRDWYPAEVVNLQNPTAATDIFMAVRSMIYLLGGDASSGNIGHGVPKGIRAFLRGSSQYSQRFRPQSAWELLVEFDELLEQLGDPYYPRRFREFQMPG